MSELPWVGPGKSLNQTSAMSTSMAATVILKMVVSVLRVRPDDRTTGASRLLITSWLMPGKVVEAFLVPFCGPQQRPGNARLSYGGRGRYAEPTILPR